MNKASFDLSHKRHGRGSKKDVLAKKSSQEILARLQKQKDSSDGKNIKKDNKDERSELLDLKSSEDTQEISFSCFAAVVLLFFIGLIIFLPKVYIANQIYYLSREINDLSGKKDVLLEERKLIKSKIEEINYKQQIIFWVPFND